MKHLGKFQHVKCFHVCPSLTSRGTAHNTFALVTLPVHHSRRCFKNIQDSFVSSAPCEDPSRRTPQPQSPKPTKVRLSRDIGETRIGTCACCRHKRMTLFASRVSATDADACAPWRRDVLTQRSGRIWFPNQFAEPDTPRS